MASVRFPSDEVDPGPHVMVLCVCVNDEVDYRHYQ